MSKELGKTTDGPGLMHLLMDRKRFRCLACRSLLRLAHDDESWVNPIYVHVDTLSEFCEPRLACPDVNNPVIIAAALSRFDAPQCDGGCDVRREGHDADCPLSTGEYPEEE